MTNLTEQCKQRKLPDGLYWVKHDGVINILDNYEAHLTEVEEVLAEVPSYEEWQELKASYEMSKDANLEQATWMVDMEKENTKLKELLKEVLRHELSLKEVSELTRKISQVLGEE